MIPPGRAGAGRGGDVSHAISYIGPVLMGEVEHELHADEDEHRRKPGGQIDQPVEQAGDKEEERPQAEQGKRVRGEHDVGLAGDPEDGRD